MFHLKVIYRFIVLLFVVLIPSTLFSQKFAEKSNLLYLATTTPNVSLEFYLSPKWTLDLTTGYNPWRWNDDASFKHWMVQPGLRFWPCRAFEGHFFEAHALYSQYNIGHIPFIPPLKEHKYEGNMYGGGIAYGYHLPLKGRWAMEFTIGVGYLYMDYEEYTCRDCKESEGMYNRNYIGPTRLGVSIIYMIK